MRHLDRSLEPPTLTRNKARWLKEFKASGDKRPNPSKYANKSIVDALKGISHSKCFYCEETLKGLPSEVDHHIEVAIDKEKAFEWNNLYLSCKSCNHKLNEHSIPSSETLDPCIDTDDEIKQHITFNREQIMPKGFSVKGDQTIKKYHLDKQEKDYLRIKQLRKVDEAIEDIDKVLIDSGRKEMDRSEKEKLLSFTLSSQPFSYMCEVYLRERRPEVFEP